MPLELEMPLPKSMRSNACAAQHFGAWSIDSKWFAQALNAIRSGNWKPQEIKAFDLDDDDDDFDDDDADPLFERYGSVALIRIEGQMTRGGSSFGGCSTIDVRQAVRSATNDSTISAIMIYVDSPGGTVAGTSDLARDIAAARQKKDVWAYIGNMGASAAYWAASQADRIYCNDTAMVGSIGTYCVLEDDTQWAEKLGVKYTVVSTGAYKGLGADGKVSDLLVSDVQREIDDLNEIFLQAVAAGRGITIERVRALADGRVHIGEKAVQEGLVDVVGTFDAAMQALSLEKPKMITNDQFKAYAAEHPEAVASYVSEGKKAGIAEATASEVNRMKAIAAACPGRADLAIKQFCAGADPESVKIIVGELDAEKSKLDESAKADKARLEAKNAELQAQIDTKTAPPLKLAGHGNDAGTGAEKKDEPAGGAEEDSDAVKVAKGEWAKMSADKRSAWLDEKAFIAVRKREIEKA